MDPGLAIGIVGLLLTGLAAYIAWEQLRRTPKTPKTAAGPAAPAIVPPDTGSTPAGMTGPNLLPRLEHPSQLAANWVGRARELEELSKWLVAEDGPPVCCIEGIMGVGKSALAWKWLYDDVLLDLGRAGLDGIFQWSFAQGKSSLGDYLLALCSYLRIDAGDQDPITALRDFLCQHKVLLVLDGFELSMHASKMTPHDESTGQATTVPADDAEADVLTARWVQMLTTLTRSHALLVSRFVPSELEGTARCLRLVLQGLTPAEAVAYLRARGVKGSTAELAAAAEFYGYHPLSLDRLVNVLRYDIVAPDDISRAKIDAPMVETNLAERQGHLFQEAFNTLPAEIKHFLGTLSAIRGQVPVAVARGVNAEISDHTLRLWLRRLEDDHWLSWDRELNILSVHPVVRRCAYSELVNRTEVHERLRAYFARVAPTVEPESRDELESLIELFHHTARLGRFDEAARLFFGRIHRSISLRYGMMTIVIELLSELFPDHHSLRPWVTSEELQFRIMDMLAYAYRVTGKSRLVLSLYESAASIAEERGWTSDLAFGLRNIVRQHMLLGDLSAAFEAQERHARLAAQAADDSLIGLSHRDLGMLKSISGDYVGAAEELAVAEEVLAGLGDRRREGMIWAYRARLAKWNGDSEACLHAARQARDLAGVEQRERDVIWAEWQLGSAFRMSGELRNAAAHLTLALHSCRLNGMTDLEPDILLDLARLRLEGVGTPSAENADRAVDSADEAMMIARRSEFRLAEADAHNVLARAALADGASGLAKEEATRARQASVCGRHAYRSALDEAETILNELGSG